MSIYDKNGNELSACYDKNGNALDFAYDKNGNEIYSSDYNRYANEYQHAILTARDEWKTEHRADDTVIPLVLSTDQHGVLNGTTGKTLYNYLEDAIKWSEVSASLNLGDTANSYSTTVLAGSNTTLDACPQAKQINVIGNHDTWGDWTDDSTAVPSDAFWTELLSYFDNSAFNGYVNYGTHQSAESMIDAEHGVKYVVFGSWNYDRSLGGHSHWVVDSDNMDAMIQALSVVDNYDVILLSHIQPYSQKNNEQLQADGTTTWYMSNTDDNEFATTQRKIDSLSNFDPCWLGALVDGRKDKTSGTIYDSYGNAHSYDFTACTSDLICTLHGHLHDEYYGWHGENRNLPVISFDNLYEKNKPFYLINVNRTQECLHIWRIDQRPLITRLTIPFSQSNDATVYLNALSVSYTGGSVVYGTTLDDLTGISVTRSYSNGSTAVLDSGWTLSGNLEVGDNTITLSYSRLTVTFTVTVTE